MRRFVQQRMESMEDLEEEYSEAMDLDDDPVNFFGEGFVVNADVKIADTDFFNSFEDDFDDLDIN